MKLLGKLQRFYHDEEGSQTIAFLVLLPLLVWSIMAMLTFTDAFRVRGMATDATAVIADSLSRQTTPIDMDDLRGFQAVGERLTGYQVALRVTQVRCVRDCANLNARTLRVDFSRGIDLDSLGNQDFTAGESRQRVPLMAEGDRLVLVETSFMHEPIAQIGLEGREVSVSHATRMRFSPQLCWEECTVS
ncbi:hypothetical protein DSM110093_00784 [Sulfitobacter sp. DSM 110093]|uniref:TadE/TadG family type IV pilus assembly protein n=1 Tax=Sulfitobacter sp. DSM 110093 TaxID=2883127 RepID=UPI001FAC65BE|nr:hypothetical protein [Sulfitobacter sp. DSM 110093]UOA31024.1 hypothetical protein DSM110093_00784 [Sulfitobacter sp. DSM 110093]